MKKGSSYISMYFIFFICLLLLGSTANLTVYAAPNAQPTGINLSNNKIDQSSPIGTVVGVITTDDPDEGDSQTYTIVKNEFDQGDIESFAIDGDQLITAKELNFEEQREYIIFIRSTDEAGADYQQSFWVWVEDVLRPAGTFGINASATTTYSKNVTLVIYTDTALPNE